MEQEINLISIDNKYLKEDTIPFDFANPPMDPEKLFKDMSKFMTEHKGVGLAANQIGLPYSVFVFGEPNSPEDHYGVFNPKIVDYSKETEYAEEGCLSFPGLWIKIKRPSTIRARFTTWDGTQDTIQLGGYSARVFQHEFDHMYGVCFQKRANIFHLEKGNKNLKKWHRLNKKKRSMDSSLLKHSASSTVGGTNV